MTDGGLGCALLWPFDLTRYFAPWRPIPVAPIGLSFFTPFGGAIALTELVLFAPLLLMAWRSRTLRTTPVVVFLAGWVVSVWLITSSHSLRDAVIGSVLREDTAYASGFSEQAFQAVVPGQSEEEVRHLLGAPLRESWMYTPAGQPSGPAAARAAASLPPECLFIRFESGRMMTARNTDACRKVGIEAGASSTDVGRLLGQPPDACFEYSKSPSEAYYRLRMVCFTRGRVETVIREWQR